jgi:hypothetical protein
MKQGFGTQAAHDQKKNLFLLGTTHKYSFPLAQIYNTYMENIDVK